MMTERLLQFIWQFQYFNTAGLQTLNGESLSVILAGRYNRDQGPDFLAARIRIGDTMLVGNIELHLEENDWSRHDHDNDPNYRNIILHVLWEKPEVVFLDLPTVYLKDRVSKILLDRYRTLMNGHSSMPCAQHVKNVTALTWLKCKERLLAERLLRKCSQIEMALQLSNYHWEEVFWWMLARNFGIPVNAEAFEAIAKSLPVIVLARHRQHVFHLEALLLGQAGLLSAELTDDYARMLLREFQFLKNKYHFRDIHQQVHFLRMRPGNFPTIRLAQLAMVLHESGFMFSRIREEPEVPVLYRLFNVTASEYWDTHYRIGEPSGLRKKTVGVQMIENIIINTVVPLLFAYGHVRNENYFKSKAISMLMELAPEFNTITQAWQNIGVENQHAWDSQALIELRKEYCNAKRCLECSIGNSVLGGADAQPNKSD